MVRDAIAALRDPKRRARDACLVRVLGAGGAGPSLPIELDAPFAGAFEAAGYTGL